ncbi:terpene synthase family protein [Streptomyces sp. NPDC008001]|uniref:terpene synthase family protein n=1 Tax=Streptomyces sp. NPDC008001 TaxID=3364804 RepID=UPI0036EB39B8
MPFPPAAPNPGAPRADAAVRSWLARFAICQSPASQQNLRRARITDTTALAYPDAAPADLVRLTQWLYWTFIMDDDFDDGPDGRDPARCEGALASLVRVLDGDPGRTPATRAFADIWQRMSAGRSRGWNKEFRRDTEDWFWTYYEDTVDRATDRYPSLDAYCYRRARGVGAHMFLTLAELGAGLDLPETLRHLPGLQDLKRAAAEYTGLNNDLWSVAKDRSVGVFHNAVVLVERHEGLSPEAAADRVAGMLDRCADQMLTAARELPAQLDAAGIAGPARAGVLACAAAYRKFVRGCFDYYYRADRYTRPEPPRQGALTPVHDLFVSVPEANGPG